MLDGTRRAAAVHDRGGPEGDSVVPPDRIRDAHRRAERRESFGTIVVAI